ncbi:probable ATP-dependent RNA helicase DDX52 [Ischnura elegans]|uniref:probable ATP-dependent RNA helicase DDX52 n=1 Tax=Ischnura elegans TaxID=197161 RepID=UPI001ED88E7D|nr:probable ATP-dependent RNA helicase DDX52 [Ischnura elegans]
MDAEDIFRKISSGAKFDTNRFLYDAQRCNLIKPKKVLGPFCAVKEESASPVNQSRDLTESGENLKSDVKSEGITILGSIRATEDGVISEKKKPKLTSKEKEALAQQEQVNRFRNQHKITVHGKDCPNPVENFEQLKDLYGLPDDLLQNIKNAGYEYPTPIQMQAVPIMLEKRQILACAPTGSGKTAAFLIPIIHHLKEPKKLGFRAVIVSPTRELAKQTHRECLRLAEGRSLRIHIISKINQAVKKFGPNSSQKFDILITTPNRLVYLLRQEPPVISLKNVEWLVVDESDKLFETGVKGFRDQLAEIYQACENPSICRAMYSATHTPVVASWCRKNMNRLIGVTIGVRNTAADVVDQELLFVGNEAGKLVAFRDIVKKGLTPPVLIFVQTKERAKELFDELIYDGINVDVIHADRTQLQRDNVVKCFRMGKIWVLICTELMGRGIDFKGVNLVINYDFPPSAISYIHRIGRTGRAGRPGKAITFFTEDDSVNLRSIAQVLRDSGCYVPDYMLRMKKASRDERRQLEQKAPKRDRISTKPLHEQEKQKKILKRLKLKKKHIKAQTGAGASKELGGKKTFNSEKKDGSKSSDMVVKSKNIMKSIKDGSQSKKKVIKKR